MAARLVFAVIAVALALAGYGFHAQWWRVPDRWNPWAPLAIEHTPNLLTRYKLGRVSRDPALCLQVLGSGRLQFEPLPDRETGPDCGYRNAVRIAATRLRVSDAFALSCPAAVSLALWEHHVVLPAAAKFLGEPLQRIEHLGSYSCRNVGNTTEGRRSQHATADALDVQGFTLRGGRRIQVQRFWGGATDEMRFLHAVRDGACTFFDGVLSPDYDAAHADHLHLDRGPYRVCR